MPWSLAGQLRLSAPRRVADASMPGRPGHVRQLKPSEPFEGGNTAMGVHRLTGRAEAQEKPVSILPPDPGQERPASRGLKACHWRSRTGRFRRQVEEAVAGRSIVQLDERPRRRSRPQAAETSTVENRWRPAMD